MYDSSFIPAYLEIISFLLKEKDWKKSSEIREYLERKNILTGNYDNNRRKLLKYLENLEYAGYIERQEGKGKAGTKWKIKNNTSLKDLITLNDKEKNALLLSLSFIPSVYKNLEFSKEIKNILKKANIEIDNKMEILINNTFSYIPNFVEKSFELDFEDLENLVEDILNQRIIYIRYKNKTRKILPLQIIFYEGLLYLLAVEDPNDKNSKIRTYRIGCLRRFQATNQTGDIISFLEKTLSPLSFEEEKPFPFAVEVPNFYIKCDNEKSNLNKFKILPTQYHLEILKNGNYKVYIIGFTGHRFYSHFLHLEIVKIYQPDELTIELMNKKLKENNEYLKNLINKETLDDLREINISLAQERFYIFKKGLNSFLNNKLKILNQS